MASQDYKAISAIAQERRSKSIPAPYLLPINTLVKLPKDLTTIPRLSGHFTYDEIEIVESEAEDILLKIRKTIWSAVEVTKAFCKAAIVANQLTNCLTEILFNEAIARAQQLDTHLAETGTVVGPLHGLPISFKDCFNIPPYPSSIGMASYANIPTNAEDEAVIVSMLRSLGVIPYCKTNIPVAMMMMETNNNVWGPTLNPYHSGLSAGGSSGGEGALIAMRGSPLGVGTDIGGSVRIPAAFCGLYGLRPSSGRFPTAGTRSGIPGQEFVLSVNGPMSRSLSSLSLYSSALLSAAPWTRDPKVHPIPWRSGSQILPTGRKLRLAFTGPTDGIVMAHPPVERALNMTRQAVLAAGHEVVEWPIGPEYLAALKLLLAAFLDFGGPAIMKQLVPHNEPVFPSMNGYEVASEASGKGGTSLGPDRMREMCLERNALAKAHLDRWRATAVSEQGKGPIDGLIMPVSPWAACREGVTNDAAGSVQYVGYTGWVNLLDLPACTFPVTRANAELDSRREKFVGGSDIETKIQADYDEVFYEGAPVALQLIGERLQEEKVLEVVGLVRDALVESDGVRR